MSELAVVEHAQEAKPRHPGGRPTLYSDAVADRICETLARGSTRLAAALEAGIDRDTFYAWLAERVEFSDRVARAESVAEVALTETVFVSGTTGETAGDWRPAVEWLKRRRRADYGDTLDIRKVDATQLLTLLQAQTEQEAITEDGEPARLTAQDVI